MIFLILLGLFQALILPGLVLSFYVKELDFRDRMIFASTLSLLANYIIVWVMYSLKIYTQTSIMIFILLEILILIKFRSLFLKEFIYLYSRTINTLNYIFKNKSISFFNLFLILYCIYYFYLLKTNGFLTVFTHWDAVVSWNRWAVELYQGTFQGSRGYPLALSILISLVYTISNETNIQTFVKYTCIFWPFLGGLVIFRCGTLFPKYKNIFGIASIIFLYLLSRGSWTSDFIFSGLVDPIMAAYGAIFLFCIIFLQSTSVKENNYLQHIIALTVLSIASSALIKMTGLILLIYLLIFTIFFLIKNNFSYSHKKYYLFLFLISTIFALHWYVLTTFYWRDWQPISEYSSLQDARIWMRPINLVVLFYKMIGGLICGLILIGMFYSKRIFLLFLFFVFPIFIFSSVTVGYDLRATFVLFAPLSILATLGLERFYSILINLLTLLFSKLTSSSKKSVLIRAATLLFLIAFLSTVLTSFFNRNEILKSNFDKRIAANNFGDNGNQKLMHIFETEPNARIISCWQTPFGLPYAQGKFIPSGNCTFTLLTGWLADPKIKYWLYRDEGNPSQLLKPEFVSQFLNNQSIPVHAESLGAGFILYSKINNESKTD